MPTAIEAQKRVDSLTKRLDRPTKWCVCWQIHKISLKSHWTQNHHSHNPVYDVRSHSIRQSRSISNFQENPTGLQKQPIQLNLRCNLRDWYIFFGALLPPSDHGVSLGKFCYTRGFCTPRGVCSLPWPGLIRADTCLRAERLVITISLAKEQPEVQTALRQKVQ